MLKGLLKQMNSIEKVWRKFIFDVLENGEKHIKDDGDVLYEHMINQAFITNVVGDLGLVASSNVNSKMFLEMIGKGAFNIEDYPIKDEALRSYVEQLDQEEQIYLERYEDSFVYTYPERIFNIYEVDKFGEVKGINQFDVVCDRLREHYGSNRAVATLYIAGLDQDEQHIPCLQWFQCTIRNDELILHIMFRSNDLYSAFPSNMLFLNYLGLKFEEELRKDYPMLRFKGINYNSTSLHIYEGDVEQARNVIG